MINNLNILACLTLNPLRFLGVVFSFLLLTISNDLGAQTHQNIATGGAILNGNNGSMSVTAGQPIINTARTGNRIVTQGFQQIDCNLNPWFYLPNSVCRNEPSITLAVEPSGGVFTGSGIVGNSFNPVLADTGLHSIKYRIEIKGCVDSIVKEIRVLGEPQVTFNITDTTCQNGHVINLTQGTPAGGNYFGVGVVNGSFFPSFLNPGTYPVTYTYQDSSTGCLSIDTSIYEVEHNPIVSVSNLPVVCPEMDSLVLNQGTPMGGSFIGPGVYNNVFIQDSVNTGSHLINYVYVDSSNGCSGSYTTAIQVDTLPSSLSFSITQDYCENDQPSLLMAGMPFGGFYQGMGNALDTFGLLSPQNTIPGSYPVKYNYTSAYGCVSSLSDSITILQKPTITLGSLASICTSDSAFTLTQGAPVGGVYQGVGILNDTLNPTQLGAGNNFISYSYTDANGCTNMDTISYAVLAPQVPQTNFPPFVCENIDTFNLQPFVSMAASFSGTNISNNMLLTAGLANQNTLLTYSTVDSNGCVYSNAASILVSPKPNVTYTPASYCSNLPQVMLSGGFPVGGSYTGSFVDTNGVLYPDQVGTTQTPVVYTYTDFNGCQSSDTANISLHNVVKPVIDEIYGICDNDVPITLNASIPNGVFLGPGVSGSLLNPLGLIDSVSSIAYKLVDANSCVTYDTIEVVKFSAPRFAETLDATVCANSPYTIELDDNLLYTWSTGDIGNKVTLHPTESQSYSVVATNGVCSATKIFTIGVSSLPTINSSKIEPLCDFSNGSITVSASGIHAPYSYHWNTGHTSPNAQQLTSGLYEVTITDNLNCKYIETIALSNDGGPSVIENSTDPTCHDATNGSIGLNFTMPTGGTFKWYHGPTSSNLTSLMDGNYHYKLADQTGCATVGTIALNAPEDLKLNFNTQPIACNAANGKIVSNVIGGTGPYNFNWSDGGSLDSIVNKAPGVYFLTVTDANNCQISEATGLPTIERVFVSIDSIKYPDCGLNNGSIGLTPMFNNYNINWSNGDTTFTVNGLSGDLYYADVTLSGCKVTLPVTLPNTQPLTPEVCVTTVDTGSGEKIVKWQGNGLTQTLYRRYNQNQSYIPVFTSNASGSIIYTDTTNLTNNYPHYYRLQSENSCNDLSEIREVNSLYLSVIINLNGKVKLIWQDENNLGDSYLVYGRKINQSNYQLVDSVSNPSKFIELDSIGDYNSFYVQTLNGPCVPGELAFSNVVNQFAKDLSIGEYEVQLKTPVNLFPNPTVSNTNIEIIAERNNEVNVSIFNNNGQRVLYDEFIVNKGYNLHSLETRYLAAGNYLVSVKGNTINASFTLVIQ